MHTYQGKSRQSSHPDAAQAAPERTRRRIDATRAPAWTGALPLRPKLTVTAPGDAFEQEADQVAARVMRMAEPVVQREPCAGCPDGESALRRQVDEEEDEQEAVQLKASSGDSGGMAAPDSVYHTLSEGGQPLDSETRAFMEPRFGQDFSGVRVHIDSQAAQSAAEVGARAYTVGQDVVFGAGEYVPGTTAGKQLIAHELAHTVQQGSAEMLARQPAPAIRPPMPMPPPPPPRPQLRVIPGGLSEPGGRAEPGARPSLVPEGGPRYAPSPYDNSLEAIFERARIAATREQAIFEMERPRATLDRGGSPPGFVTVEREELGMWDWGNARYRIRHFHILDAIEYGVEQATTVEQIQRVRDRYIGAPVNPFSPSSPVGPMIVPGPDFVVLPNDFDPGAIVRQRVYSAAIRRRIARSPELAGASRLAAEADVDAALERMGRRRRYPGAYPICWATQLQVTLGTHFVRTRSERDEDEQKQARMAAEWRAFRDPNFDPRRFHVHHVVPLFLGGEDNLRTNGIYLERFTHLRGHWVLRFQPQMRFPLPPLRPMPVDLYEHPPGTEYELVGFKSSESSLCVGDFSSTEGFVHP